VLGSTTQRTAPASFSSRSSGPLRRRLVLGVLVVVSLLLITVYFRESESGALHDLQGAGAGVLRPFEVAATRVARPFQDLYDYVAGFVGAKSERDRLRAENARLRQEIVEYRAAALETGSLKTALNYISGPRFPNDFKPVTASIISKPPSQFEQQVVIGAGSANGIVDDAPVVSAQGLVGKVTKVAGHEAQVTLLTDEDSAVSAIDLHTRAEGIVRHGHGPGSTLFLDQVPRSEHVAVRDRIVTSGWKNGALSSIYPRGIAIGWVSSANFSSNNLFAQVQVTPYVDFSSLDSVIVLVPKRQRSGR
jgi:rod shape-determining protein MreC